MHYDRVIESRPNYHIIAENAVAKVNFKDEKAVRVQFVNKSTGEVSNVTAKKEVIIAAGAVHSPQILQLSGVGDMSVLEMLGIEVVLDLPGAGQNFRII